MHRTGDQLYGNTGPPPVGRRCPRPGCGQPCAPHHCCGKPKCVAWYRAAERARWKRTMLKRREKCRFCAFSSLPGRAVCAQHQYRKLPCPAYGQIKTCTQRVPYNDARGPAGRSQRIYCSAQCRVELNRIWKRQNSFRVKPDRTNESEHRITWSDIDGPPSHDTR
jgi:hypothetical protein